MSRKFNLIKKAKMTGIPWIFILAWGIPIGILVITLSSPKAKSFNLPEEPGKIIGGSIAYDGRFFWGTRILLSFGAEMKKEIIKFNSSGEEIKTFIPKKNFCGIAFDGERLWTADAVGSTDNLSDNGKFYTIDPETGKLMEQFAIHKDYMLEGITGSEHRLWVWGKHAEDENIVFLWQINPYSESILHEIELSPSIAASCSGITFFGGNIWAVVGMTNKEVLKITPQRGRIVETYDLSGEEINGIVTDGENILLADGEAHKLNTLDSYE